MSWKRIITRPECFDDAQVLETIAEGVQLRDGGCGTIYMDEISNLYAKIFRRGNSGNNDIISVVKMFSKNHTLIIKIKNDGSYIYSGDENDEKNKIASVNPKNNSSHDVFFTLCDNKCILKDELSTTNCDSPLQGEKITKIKVYGTCYSSPGAWNYNYTAIKAIFSDEPIDPRSTMMELTPKCTGEWTLDTATNRISTPEAMKTETIFVDTTDKNLAGKEIIAEQIVIGDNYGGGKVRALQLDDRNPVELMYKSVPITEDATEHKDHKLVSLAQMVSQS